ncbi:MAG TPA: IS1595 family transposase [Gemmatimonadaceae bacterium]|nr:IS1595 family transposase [Gemmatimonadaceae bacterium]
MIKQHAYPQSLSEAIRFFADPDVALAFIVQLRWPNGVICPRCEAEKPSYLTTRRIWKCRSCRKQFSVKVGTIFEDSALGLDKWLPALWMLANCRNGISSYELGRHLHVTQKTAWFMLGRIRLAMHTKSFEKRQGTLEIDEAFFGGLAQNMHAAKRRRVLRGTKAGAIGKAGAVAAVRRGTESEASKVLAYVLRDPFAKPHGRMARETVLPGSKVYTDSATLASDSLSGYIRKMINHSAKQYVRGDVHTNSVENFWSNVKRMLKGTYISVDPIHLFRYLNEAVYRFNVRKDSERDRFSAVVRNIVGKRLTYAELINAGMPPATT